MTAFQLRYSGVLVVTALREESDVLISSQHISRNHLEFYAIVEDLNESPVSVVSPRVFVRDRKSSNGTFVNDHQIGSPSMLSPGWLLAHGDKIVIKPHWVFVLIQPSIAEDALPQISAAEAAEAQLFQSRFRLTRQIIGQGSHGLVRLAIDNSTLQQVVCKVVPIPKSHLGTNDPVFRRLVQELDILRQLDHPNILSFVAAIRSPHRLFCFTELAAGGDLFSFMLRDGGLDEWDIKVVMRQVVRAVAYLHKRGVVHRDIKPENIFFRTVPKIGHRVVIGDFTCAGVPKRARLLSRVGTELYLAPETLTLQSDGHLQTPAVDVWSIGLLCLFMIDPSHQLWFSELVKAQQSLLDTHLDTVFQAVSLFSSSGQDFVRKCIRSDPTSRISSAQAFRHHWFQSSAKEVAALRRLDKETLGDWTPRQQILPIVEELPDIGT